MKRPFRIGSHKQILDGARGTGKIALALAKGLRNG